MLPMRRASPPWARADRRGTATAVRPPPTAAVNWRRVIMMRSFRAPRSASHALALRPAEQPAGAEEHEKQEQEEGQHVLELRGDEAGSEGFQQAEEQSPRDSTEGVAEAAGHRGREPLEPE